MKLAKSIAIATAAFGLTVGSAFAVEGQSGMNDSWYLVESQPIQQDTFILLDPPGATYVYGVDEDGDGVPDSYLFLEQSDTLG